MVGQLCCSSFTIRRRVDYAIQQYTDNFGSRIHSPLSLHHNGQGFGQRAGVTGLYLGCSWPSYRVIHDRSPADARGQSCLQSGRTSAVVVCRIANCIRFNRHSPDSRGFGARIAPLTGLGNGKCAVASKRRSKPAVDGTATLKRAALPASRHTSPLVACRI